MSKRKKDSSQCGAAHRLGPEAAAVALPLRLTCDKERGHTGLHRGYYEAIDAPMFWADVSGEERCPTCDQVVKRET